MEFLPAERVLSFNAKDNFWEMGATGPCGLCVVSGDGRMNSRILLHFLSGFGVLRMLNQGVDFRGMQRNSMQEHPQMADGLVSVENTSFSNAINHRHEERRAHIDQAASRQLFCPGPAKIRCIVRPVTIANGAHTSQAHQTVFNQRRKFEWWQSEVLLLVHCFARSGKRNHARARDGAPGLRSVAIAGALKPSAAHNYYMS